MWALARSAVMGCMSDLLSGLERVAVAEDAVWVEAVLELLQPGGDLGSVRRRNRGRALVRCSEEVHEPTGGVPWGERFDHLGARGLDRWGQARHRRAEHEQAERAIASGD